MISSDSQGFLRNLRFFTRAEHGDIPVLVELYDERPQLGKLHPGIVFDHLPSMDYLNGSRNEHSMKTFNQGMRYGIIVLLIVAGCSRRDPLSTFRIETQEIILIDAWETVLGAIDPATIRDARIDGDRLTLKVAYKGGNQIHVFQLYAYKIFMESYPAQSAIFLSHGARGDEGDSLIVTNLKFDLSPLKDLYNSWHRDGGPLLLRIHEPGDTANFKFLIAYEF